MTHEAKPPFFGWVGPRNARCVFVGEAWGEREDSARQPFVGESGKELWRMLGEASPDDWPDLHAAATAQHRYGDSWIGTRGAWLAAASVAFTNVLAFRPPSNKIEAICVSKKELPNGYDWPAIKQGKYLRPEFLPEIDRLYRELAIVRPNLVVALGGTACWALLRASNIGTIRGTITTTLELAERAGDSCVLKLLPTYHPAGVLYNWSWRSIVCMDLAKAHREAAFPEVRRPQRQILVDPTIEEVEAWTAQAFAENPARMTSDTETGAGQIKMQSFAYRRDAAIVIPFVDFRKPGGSYWSSAVDESRAWRCVERLLNGPWDMVWQNGLYDAQYDTRMGFKCPVDEDTMLLHHSMWPEMPKGLGFLGSVYTNEASWKLMRRKIDEQTKKDE